jgi:hypothetical protein
LFAQHARESFQNFAALCSLCHFPLFFPRFVTSNIEGVSRVNKILEALRSPLARHVSADEKVFFFCRKKASDFVSGASQSAPLRAPHWSFRLAEKRKNNNAGESHTDPKVEERRARASEIDFSVLLS